MPAFVQVVPSSLQQQWNFELASMTITDYGVQRQHRSHTRSEPIRTCYGNASVSDFVALRNATVQGPLENINLTLCCVTVAA